MTVLAGTFGAVNSISSVRNWSFDEISAPVRGVSSSTRGGSMRRGGIRSWNGKVSLYGMQSALLPGDIFNFQGYSGPTTAVKGTNGIIHSGSAIVEQAVYNWNWTTNDFLTCELTFNGNGAITHASGVAITDATTPDVPTTCGQVINIAATPVTDVISATWTISEASSAEVSSSTNCWTNRKKGSGLDWTLSIVRYNDSGMPPVTLRSDSIIELPVTGANVWSLKWGHLESITGVVIDVETGALTQETLNFSMNANVAGAIGWIRKPGAAVDWWPLA